MTDMADKDCASVFLHVSLYFMVGFCTCDQLQHAKSVVDAPSLTDLYLIVT